VLVPALVGAAIAVAVAIVVFAHRRRGPIEPPDNRSRQEVGASIVEAMTGQMGEIETMRTLARNERRQGRLDNALRAYDRLVAAAPADAAAWNERGILHGMRGDPKRALADFDKAVELRTDDAEPRLNRAGALAEIGDAVSAIAELDRVIALAPQLAQAYADRGLAYAASGDTGHAIADIERFLELAPDAPDAAQARGKLAQLRARRS
jgi:regulator of sirC expression with transglutaminase-like and TPR domain